MKPGDVSSSPMVLVLVKDAALLRPLRNVHLMKLPGSDTSLRSAGIPNICCSTAAGPGSGSGADGSDDEPGLHGNLPDGSRTGLTP